MSQLKKSTKHVGSIVLISLVGKVLGFIREALIASTYGSGVETDTFFIALSGISLFSTLLIHTINTTLIPILSDIEVHEGRKEKNHHLNNFLNTIILIAIIIAFSGYFLTPSLMKLLGRGFGEEQFSFAIQLTRIGLPILVISSAVGIFRGLLQSEERFTESAIAELPFNIVSILFLFFLADRFGILALMVVTIMAEASRLLTQIPGLKKIDYHYKFIIDLDNIYMKRLIRLIPPVLLSVGISDLNALVDKSMASSLVTGSVSALNYANVLNGIVLGVFISAITTVIFPQLSKEANAQNFQRLKEILSRSFNIVLLITIPASIGMIVLSKPVVKFAFQRGEFDELAAMMTASALVFYSIGLVGSGIKALLTPVYYALQDTKTPMKNSFYALVLNIFFNLILVQPMAHNGLALASSLSTILTTIILIYELRKKIGPLGLRLLIQSTFRILLSALIMGFVVFGVYLVTMPYLASSRTLELIALITIILLGAVVYFTLLYLLKVEEFQYVVSSLRKKWK